MDSCLQESYYNKVDVSCRSEGVFLLLKTSESYKSVTRSNLEVLTNQSD